MTLIRKAQSVTEYAILLGLAIAAFAGMQIYVKRSLNARIKKGADVATGAGAGYDINAGGAIVKESEVTGVINDKTSFGKQSQYEPYYVDSSAKTYSEDVSREQLSGAKLKKEIVSNVQATAGGGYSAEKTFNSASGNATVANQQWE